MEKDTFAIYIEFEEKTKNPSKIFSAMSQFIDTMTFVDNCLIESLNIKAESVFVLEDIQLGSLKSILKSTLTSIDDEDLKELNTKKIIGTFLVKGKEYLLDKINEKEGLTDKKELEEVKTGLLELAKETDIEYFETYRPITEEKLLTISNRVVENTISLGADQKISYMSSDSKIEIKKDLNVLTNTEVAEMLTKETVTNEMTMIVKVKKPDFLGISQWELRHEEKNFQAKMLDTNWLKKFQSRRQKLGPGDSLKAKIRTEVLYGYDNEVLDTKYYVVTVIDVLFVDHDSQRKLFDDGKN